MHKESAYAFLPYDRAKVRGLIIDYIEDHDTRCGLIAENDSTIIGMIGSYLIDYYFCNETLVSHVLGRRPPGAHGRVTS
jgi:hypothetical protein